MLRSLPGRIPIAIWPAVRAAAIATLLGLVLATAPASAHPIGNFTINHYAGLWISPTEIAVDYVLDMAEIPTFGERDRIDTDGDGDVDAAETEAERLAACPRVAPDLDLRVGGTRLVLRPIAAGLTFPPGASGYDTLRLVCEFDAAPSAPIVGPIAVSFADRTWSDRLGWREIVVDADGLTVTAGDVTTTSISHRLTQYPPNLIDRPLNVASVEFTLTPGGPYRARPQIPDARPLPGAARVTAPPSASGPPASIAVSAGAAPGESPGPTASVATAPAKSAPPVTGSPSTAAVPGGVGNGVPFVDFRTLTPGAFLGAFLLSVVLGAAHALTPGHGKTLMAAYLVGSRGAMRYALPLAASVAISHTIGVAILAAFATAVAGAVAPERVYPALTVASGVIAAAVGAVLLVARWRERTHHDGHHVPEPSPNHGVAAASRRSLIAFGIVGGLVPSASAFLLLLAALAAHQPAVGLVLVLGFGIGLAAALVGVGLALVHGVRFVSRRAATQLRPLVDLAPLAAALLVVIAGVALAVGGFAGAQ